MRIFTILAVAVAALSFGADGAKAQYGDKWCAWYDAYANNCGFATMQQCLATVSGVGGICRLNVNAAPFAAEPRRRPHKRKRHRN